MASVASRRTRFLGSLALAGGWMLSGLVAGCDLREGRGHPGDADPAVVAEGMPPDPRAEAGGLRGPLLHTGAARSWMEVDGPAPGARATACPAAEPLAGDALSIRDQVDLQRIRRCARRWWWS